MENFILDHEATIRTEVFASIFVAMVVWELLWPRRRLSLPRRVRWPGNLGLLLVDALLLRLAFPAAAVGFAAFAQHRGWGLFHAVALPSSLAIVASVVLLDLAIYWQHVLSHRLPVLWRIHRVHHADPDFDMTTGLRFHPIEILLSMGFKFLLIVALGPPLVAVIVFEVLLNGTAMFNHGNVSLPVRIDRWLRWLIVTPDMHRVHHSIHGDETHRNFGFNLALWDRLFNTYQAQPRMGHRGATIGLPVTGGYHTCVNFPRMLGLPFHDALDSGGRNDPDSEY